MQFFSGGSVIGTTSVAELPFDLNSLKFSSELDVNTKAMMVATTCHVVFLLNYEITRDRVKCGWLPKLVFYAFIFFFVGSLVFVMTRPCQMEEVKLLDEQRAGNATSGLETHNFSIFRMGFGK
ncbi:unnamed protein product [Allacma fusca]|uniref:Transmembrane protein n=1 Tax=Allacma fusca TaxID=39272 RepID=A0A8J2JIK9_9HEXA|nr:unnamed protein product [Allacma fusca]